jgi:hypothetical protein
MLTCLQRSQLDQVIVEEHVEASQAFALDAAAVGSAPYPGYDADYPLSQQGTVPDEPAIQPSQQEVNCAPAPAQVSCQCATHFSCWSSGNAVYLFPCSKWALGVSWV